ncbi:MAG: P1 family peptidase [Janthinobacterium lividum]
MLKPRARDLGIKIGSLQPGGWNSITDVAGVAVGYSTLLRDSPTAVRTGVTAVWPRPFVEKDPVFAGLFSFNGYGELTGSHWVIEQGIVQAPICITSTNSTGLVRDAIVEHLICRSDEDHPVVQLPVVGETWDGCLSDINALAITKEMVFEALVTAQSGSIAEGNVGGGTGMICHEFKGGTGTSSRRTPGGYTVGVIVQANYGRRELLTIQGVPIGRAIGIEEIPSPTRDVADGGSIIVIIATDAPLLPIQCQRLARRATVGLGRVGGIGANGSGDIFLAFSTANHISDGKDVHSVQMLSPQMMTPLFQAVAEATEEAIINAMIAAESMTGCGGRTAYALPHDRLLDVLNTYRWSPAT